MAVDDDDDEKVEVEEEDDQIGDFGKSLVSFSFKTFDDEQSRFLISMMMNCKKCCCRKRKKGQRGNGSNKDLALYIIVLGG